MAYSGATPTSVPLSGDDLSDGIISEAKLGTDAVSLAKMKAGVDGNIISYDASGNVVAIATGSDSQVLTSTGAGSPPAFEALPAGGWSEAGLAATTTGANNTINGLPSGIKLLIISFDAISPSEAAAFQLRLGDSGGIETTGYTSVHKRIDSTTITTASGSGSFYLVNAGSGADLISGSCIMTRAGSSSNVWSINSQARQSTAGNNLCNGSKTLTGELTQLQILLSAGSFDAGSWNIYYQA
jgi:hypothetical protein